jgi:molecular chaperone GrpE
MSEDKAKESGTRASQTEATTTESVETKSELQLAQDESAKWKNEYLYMRAEFENYKKNAIKERSDLLKFGAERVARDVLEVMDNFERALEIKISAETLQSFKTGVELTAKELKDALAKHGIHEVPSLAEPFNPLHHEAISSEATAAVPVGHVSRVFKKPYKLHDKIIRMGQVVVATEVKSDSKTNSKDAN